jgi:hypothetical protein
MRLTPDGPEECGAEVDDPMSDAGMAGMAAISLAVVDVLPPDAPAPWEVAGWAWESGEAVAAEPTAYGTMGDCDWAVRTMVRLALGGMSRADALR